jgi:hypothetical protein
MQLIIEKAAGKDYAARHGLVDLLDARHFLFSWIIAGD